MTRMLFKMLRMISPMKHFTLFLGPGLVVVTAALECGFIAVAQLPEVEAAVQLR